MIKSEMTRATCIKEYEKTVGSVYGPPIGVLPEVYCEVYSPTQVFLGVAISSPLLRVTGVINMDATSDTMTVSLCNFIILSTSSKSLCASDMTIVYSMPTC
jgi:hypothetical protein